MADSHDIVPTNTLAEVVSAEVRVALAKENGFVRGWQAAGDPEILAAIEAQNARERARCKAALLARFTK